MIGKERVKGRGHAGAADPCNAAMGKIKERETIYRLAIELHLELGSLHGEKTELSKDKGDAYFQIKHKNYHEGGKAFRRPPSPWKFHSHSSIV